MKLGLFGGTFDPIHNGHLHIARAFADQLHLSNVIFLPAGDPYHKIKTQTSASHRFAMTQLAIEYDERFAVSDLDMVREGATYTIDTLHIFKQHYPNAQLWWLLGMDSLMQLHTWKNWQSLVRQTHIAVAARQGQTLNQAPQALHNWLGQALHTGSLTILSAPMMNVSSTHIREQIALGKQDVVNLMPQSVWQYIQNHHLYQNANNVGKR